MITRISIENFKGIGDRVVVPIRPITLLFGPNSAGKSTIMHAIHYAREVLERHNVDADQTVAGGDRVNLGGFREMIYRKDKDRKVVLRFDLDLSSVPWHEEFPVEEFLHEYGTGTAYDDLSTLGLDVMTGWVEFVIGFDEAVRDGQPVVLSYSVGLDEIPLASLKYVPYERKSDSSPRGAVLTNLNLHHPAFAWPESQQDSLGPVDFYFPDFCNVVETLYFGPDVKSSIPEQDLRSLVDNKTANGHQVTVHKDLELFELETIRLTETTRDDAAICLWIGRTCEGGHLEIMASAAGGESDVDADAVSAVVAEMLELAEEEEISRQLTGQPDALPNWQQGLEIELEESFYDLDEESSVSEGSSSVGASDRPLEFVHQLLTRLIVGPGKYLRDHLTDFRYVGPIRDVPPPEHVPPRYHDPSRWASGMAAWDLLADTSNEALAETVSDWLWNDDRLNTGYQLVAKRVREIEGYLQDRMLRVEWEEGKPSDLTSDILSELESLPERHRVYIRDVERGVDLSACSVGLGISQVVPVIVAVVADAAEVVQIEQPALHLHPTQEAAVGDLLIDGALAGKRKVLLIETHSVPMILRILRRIRQTHQGHPFNDIPVRPADVIVLYVEPADGQTTAFEIAIGDDGEFLQPWPDKFFDQDYEERYG